MSELTAQERKDDLEVRRSLPVDDEMLNSAERIWCFQQKNEVSFDEAFKILLITQLDTKDRTLHNSTLEIATTINDIGGSRW